MPYALNCAQIYRLCSFPLHGVEMAQSVKGEALGTFKSSKSEYMRRGMRSAIYEEDQVRVRISPLSFIKRDDKRL